MFFIRTFSRITSTANVWKILIVNSTKVTCRSYYDMKKSTKTSRCGFFFFSCFCGAWWPTTLITTSKIDFTFCN